MNDTASEFLYSLPGQFYNAFMLNWIRLVDTGTAERVGLGGL